MNTPVFAAGAGWQKTGDAWIYVLEDGSNAEGIMDIDGHTYCFGSGGKMLAKEWALDNGSWYFFDSAGHRKENSWLKWGSDWYYLNADGKMAAGAVIDGYPVDHDGRWVKADTIQGTYSYSMTGYDWGCGVDKAIVQFEKAVEGITPAAFTVSETKQATNYADPTFPVEIVTVSRTVTDAYPCDANGNKVSGPSEFAAIELYVSPSEGSPINYSMHTKYNTWSNPYILNINLSKGASLTAEGKTVKFMDLNKTATGKTTNADAMKTSKFTATDGLTLNYGLWKPSTPSKTLFVWVHGQGEGSYEVAGDTTNPYVTALANKVTAFFGDEFQETLGGANVLIPQCPTYWRNPDIWLSHTESYYNQALTELIDKKAKELGCDKIVIAGCSSGGFMTMSLALYNGDKYDAYIPICEAMKDADISDEQIQDLAKLNMYFIWTDDDTTVVPEEGPIPTSTRIKEAGGNVTTWHRDHVWDTSGKYFDADGNPHKYSGHWSWIYFDNNEAHDKGNISVWEWIAEQIQ